jgi:hypothetical protein
MALKVLFLSLLFEQKEAQDQLPNTSTTRTRPHHINMWQMRTFVISWWSLNWTGLGIYIVAMIRKLGRYQIS